MHSRELVELAALVAAHAPAFLRSGRLLSNAGVEHYWAASKCRLDRWGRALKNYCSGLSRDGRESPRRGIRPVLEEILTGEVLTRVWAGAASGCDRRRGVSEVEPLVYSVFTGHLEARNRVLYLMVSGKGFTTEEAVALNRLRRRAERWTDLLVGFMMTEEDLSEFAFDPERATQFGSELRQAGGASGYHCHWQLVLASLRAAFREGLCNASPNADLNRRIAASVVACLRQELADSTGLLESFWLERLNATACDTQRMIEELLALDGPAPPLHSFPAQAARLHELL